MHRAINEITNKVTGTHTAIMSSRHVLAKSNLSTTKNGLFCEISLVRMDSNAARQMNLLYCNNTEISIGLYCCHHHGHT